MCGREGGVSLVVLALLVSMAQVRALVWSKPRLVTAFMEGDVDVRAIVAKVERHSRVSHLFTRHLHLYTSKSETAVKR